MYTVLGRAEPALWHARRCLDLCEQHGLADWDLAYAYEAVARAYKTSGDVQDAETYKRRAAEVPIAEADDREHFEQDLATL